MAPTSGTFRIKHQNLFQPPESFYSGPIIWPMAKSEGHRGPGVAFLPLPHPTLCWWIWGTGGCLKLGATMKRMAGAESGQENCG